MRRLPTFLVIGAPKAGTTSLHHYLAAHPQVFVAGELGTTREELDFFVEELNWSRGLDWYRAQFEGAGSAKAVGEVSPRYTQHPYYRGVAERAARVVPDAQLVYLIREPIEQMVSHYGERRRWASEPAPLNRALLENPVYLETARYASQLEQFLAHFPRERVHVVVAEQLRAPETRRSALARVLSFLGVGAHPAHDALVQDHNVGVAPRRRLFQRFAGSWLWDPLTAAAPGWLKRPLSPLVHRRRPAWADLDERVERELVARLRDDVARLRELMGDEFPAWPRMS